MEPNQNVMIQGNMIVAQNGYVPPQQYQGQFGAQNQVVYMPANNMQMPLLMQLFPAIQPRMGGLDKLMAINGVFIKQKFMALQAVTGCEQQHRHFVYALGSDGKHKKGGKIFKCSERSNCLMRQCCSPHCRSFNMDVNNKDYYDPGFDGTPFLKFERPFKCTLLCCNRPELKVRLTEGGQDVVLGKVVNPFQCCDLKMDVYDATDALKYYVVGSCCQCGILCEGPCFQGASFDIKTPGGDIVGTLKRVRASFLENVVETVANFSVTFPQNANGPDRALLIGATIMMDYIYFDKKSKGIEKTARDDMNVINNF
jgi:hypothetical protein